MRNATCSTAEALRRFEPVLAAARRAGVQVRGYVSCVVGCPYEGSVDPTRVAEVAAYFLNVNRNKLGIVMALRETRYERTRPVRRIDAVRQRAVDPPPAYGQLALLGKGARLIAEKVLGLPKSY